jgi:uncharacterized membrane protein YbhN (UPF0104 family)
VARGRLRALYRGRSRKLLILAGSVCVTVGVIGLISRAAHYHQLEATLDGSDRRWFGPMLIGEALAYAGYIMAYRSIAAVFDGPRLTLWMTTRIVAAGFGAMVAATSAGGLAVDYWALRRAGAERHSSIARVLALNTLEWAVLSVGAALASIAVLIGGGYRTVWLEIGWVVVVTICYVLATILSGPRFVDHLTHPHDPGRPRLLLADAMAGVVICREIIRHPVNHPGALPGIAVYWAGDMLCLWAALQGVGIELSPQRLVLGYATGYLATMLPLPLAGAGAVDAAMVYGLTLVGVPLAASLIAVVGFRLVNFWLPLIPAAFAALGMRRLRRQLPEAVHPRPAPRGSEQQPAFGEEFEEESL